MSKTVYEVECKFCASLFDTDNLNFICPCQSKEGSTVFKKYWIICDKNRWHHYWSNRSEDCKICLDEKIPIITIKHEGLKINGEIVKPSIERPDQSLLTSIGFEQRNNIIKQLEQEKQTQLQILDELKKINQSREPHDLEDK
jgi:hypothetical protein